MPELPVADWLADRLAGYVDDIAELVRIPTVPPDEARAFDWLTDYFGSRGEVRLEPRHPELAEHPMANHNTHLARPATDRATVVVEVPGTADLPRTLFSGHVDVVPATPEFTRAFQPQLVDGALVGRGTADTKGNIVMVAAALDYLREHRLPHGPIALDLVVEEEIGGNGALSAALHGRAAQQVVVLEPTGLEVFHGHRGCLEFTAELTGQASHMGGSGLSAIDGAIEFVAALRRLEARMIADAQRDPAFRGYARPVQINVGTIHGGEWHGSLPERCSVGGAFGFHPDLGLPDVRSLLTELTETLSPPWRTGRIDLTYQGIHNGAYLGDPDTSTAAALRAAVRSTGVPTDQRRAWCVSCDARIYHELLGVPTVVFGAGQLADAHSGAERLVITEWQAGVRALVRFLTARDGEA